MSEHKEEFTVGVSENVDVIVKTDANIAEPSRYNVVFLNDDYTPMDFVSEILINIFHRTTDEADAITLAIHAEGKGIAGSYTYEIAEQKALEATSHARSNNFPLQIQVEKV